MIPRCSLVALRLVILVALATAGCTANIVPTHHLVWEPIVADTTTEPAPAHQEPPP